MRKLLISAVALGMTAPAHALSIVSLHGAPASTGAVGTGTVIAALTVLVGVVAYRLLKR
jgi:hypothetical protein